MTHLQSQFSPPRAGFGRNLRWIGTASRFALRKQVTLRVSVEYGVRLLLAVAIPSVGFAMAGWRRGAFYALGGYVFSASCVLVFLGFWPASLAGGMMVGIHSMGAVYFLNRQQGLKIRAIKIAAAVCCIIALFLYVYMPATRLIEKGIYPFLTPGGPIIVDTRTPVESVQRGDVVAFRIDPVQIDNYRVNDGAGVGRVLGLPGDVIRFSPGKFTVNGIAQPAEPGMPEEGELTVAVGHRFIWTPLRRNRYDNDPLSGITFALSKRISMVPEGNIIGRPFDRWFWRKQRYEPVQ